MFHLVWGDWGTAIGTLLTVPAQTSHEENPKAVGVRNVPLGKQVLASLLTALGAQRRKLSDTSTENAYFDCDTFPEEEHGVGRQLPEDFAPRGFAFASYYYPRDFFSGKVVDEEERQLELPTDASARGQRRLWLEVRVSSLGRYMTRKPEAVLEELQSVLSVRLNFHCFDKLGVLIALSGLPCAQARPVPTPGTLAEAIEDEFAQLIRAAIAAVFSWSIPSGVFAAFVYALVKMPPAQHLSQYRMMALIVSLGPLVGSVVQGSVPWLTVLNAVSFCSVARYAQSSRPGFHRSHRWLVFIFGGALMFNSFLGWTFSPSQGIDSKFFGQLLALSLCMMVVVMDFVTSQRTLVRSALAGLSEMLS